MSNVDPNTCAICQKPLEPQAARESSLYPFCSQRCKMVDLNRWFGGEYAVVSKLDLQDLSEVEVDEMIAKLEAQ